jgi:hypothetical protein
LPVALLLGVGSLAFFHLMALPPFEDEGTQLRWIFRSIEAGEWLQPLADGKPLEAWPMVPLARLDPHPLAAIRALHVLAGLIGALLTYGLALQLGNRWTACASGVLYILCPFVVYLERLALSDIFMCTAGLAVLLCIIKFFKSPTRSHAGLLALSFVLAAFAKFPVGFVFLIAVPLALLLMPSLESRRMLRRPEVNRLLAAHAPVLLLALAVIAVAAIRLQRGLSPGFGLEDLAGIGMGRYSDIAAVIGISSVSLPNELTAQLSWPVVLTGTIGLAAGALHRDWHARWLIAVAALPLLGIGLLAHFWFSRYLLFTLPPLIIGAVLGWQRFGALFLRFGPHDEYGPRGELWPGRRFGLLVELAAFALCAGFMGHQSAMIVLDPAAASWSPLDRFQFFEGWSSGYGYPEAAKFLLRAPDAPPMIYSLDGHSAYQLRSYLPAQWARRVQPVFYGESGTVLRSPAARLANLTKNIPAWIIVSEQLLPRYLESDMGPTSPDQFTLRQIAVFDKPGLRTRLAIYEVGRP